MRALLQMTMETEDTTERPSAPTVPSWNFSPPTPIFAATLQAIEPPKRPRLPDQTTPLTPPAGKRDPISISQSQQRALPGNEREGQNLPRAAAVDLGKEGVESGRRACNGVEICGGDRWRCGDGIRGGAPFFANQGRGGGRGFLYGWSPRR